jgi:hypothetical protein
MAETRVGEIIFASDKSLEIAVDAGIVVLRMVDIEIETTLKMSIETAGRLVTHLNTARLIADKPHAIENMNRAQS